MLQSKSLQHPTLLDFFSFWNCLQRGPLILTVFVPGSGLAFSTVEGQPFLHSGRSGLAGLAKRVCLGLPRAIARENAPEYSMGNGRAMPCHFANHQKRCKTFSAGHRRLAKPKTVKIKGVTPLCMN